MITPTIYVLSEAGAQDGDERGQNAAGARTSGPSRMESGKEGENRWELIKDY